MNELDSFIHNLNRVMMGTVTLRFWLIMPFIVLYVAFLFYVVVFT